MTESSVMSWYRMHESMMLHFIIVIIEGSLLSRFLILISITPMDGSLVIMEGGLLSRFFLLQWMVALSLWKVVCCRYLFYSIGW